MLPSKQPVHCHRGTMDRRACVTSGEYSIVGGFWMKRRFKCLAAALGSVFSTWFLHFNWLHSSEAAFIWWQISTDCEIQSLIAVWNINLKIPEEIIWGQTYQCPRLTASSKAFFLRNQFMMCILRVNPRKWSDCVNYFKYMRQQRNRDNKDLSTSRDSVSHAEKALFNMSGCTGTLWAHWKLMHRNVRDLKVRNEVRRFLGYLSHCI